MIVNYAPRVMSYAPDIFTTRLQNSAQGLGTSAAPTGSLLLLSPTPSTFFNENVNNLIREVQ
jgi:hypothetical protein